MSLPSDRGRRGPHDDLWTLSARYASAVDRRDGDGLVELFTPDASLVVRRPGRDERSLAGADQLRTICTAIARWPRTQHVLGQSLYEVDGDRASGEVYCTAHHFGPDGDGACDVALHIRYLDAYRWRGAGWHIERRLVHVDAETRAVAVGILAP